MRKFKTLIFIVSALILLLLGSAAYAYQPYTEAAIVILKPDVTLADIAPFIAENRLDLLEDRITHQYKMGDTLTASVVFTNTDNVAQFEAAEWQFIDRVTENRIKRFKTDDEDQEGVRSSKSAYRKQFDEYVADKEIFDKTVAGCWDTLTCPSLIVTQLTLATITDEQISVLESSSFIEEVQLPRPHRFLRGLRLADFDWRPQNGRVFSDELEEKERVIEVSAVWTNNPRP